MFGLHRNVIRKKIVQGEIRAHRNQAGHWRIPLVSLQEVADRWESVLLRERLAK